MHFEDANHDALMERYAIACDFRQRVDEERIEAVLLDWFYKISHVKTNVRFVRTVREFILTAQIGSAANAARDALDAWGDSAANAAWNAWAVWGDSAANAAWNAWAVWGDSAANAANAGRSANAARSVWNHSLNISCNCDIIFTALSKDQRGLFEKWFPFLEALEAGAWTLSVTPYTLYVAPIPSSIKLDERRRLHSEDEPAFRWLDIADYYWHGVRVPQHVITNPLEITVKEIESEQNAEVRRVLVEQFGQERYLIESNAFEVHRDDYGTLYRKDLPNDEPLVMVKVVNSTPEQDGTFKDYFLRVPPQITRARDAVAWSFDVESHQYELERQS